MADPFLTPDDLGLMTPSPAAAPMAPALPPLQGFLPKPNLAQKIAPVAALVISALLGKHGGGAGFAQGFSRGQQQVDAENMHRAQIAQQEAIQNQHLQQQAAFRAQQDAERRQQVLMGALQTIKTRVGTITDKAQYDREMDTYANMLQMSGFRVNGNQLRMNVPFVAKTAKTIAGEAVTAWLKNPANAAALRKDPSLVGRAVLRIDTNGDGVAENVPLVRAGELGGIQFATDEQGQPLAIEGDAKIADPFKELYGAKLARFAADNRRQPTPKEKEALVTSAVREAKEAGREPAAAEDAAIALSPAGLDVAALNYAKTGQLPPMGMGKSGAAVRTKIINRAAEKYGGMDPLDVAANKASYAANQGSLTQLTKIANATEAFAKTASDNLDLALTQSGQVARTESKLVNRYLQWAQGELSPAEGLTQFETYVYTAAREYAKVTSGAAMSAQGLTDSAAREATKLLNTAQSPRAFAAAVKAMKDDMANVRANYKAQIAGLQGQMRSVSGAAPAPASPADTTVDPAASARAKLAKRKQRP